MSFELLIPYIPFLGHFFELPLRNLDRDIDTDQAQENPDSARIRHLSMKNSPQILEMITFLIW